MVSYFTDLKTVRTIEQQKVKKSVMV